MTQQKSNRPSDFIDALVRMQKECNVYQLKLSDWGVKEEELPLMVQNARDTMGSLFTLDPRPLTDEEVLQITRNLSDKYRSQIQKEEQTIPPFFVSQF